MFEFDIFKGEVLHEYQQKRDQGQLDTRLENPSPANLRNYAYILYQKGLSKDDEQIFKEYFGELDLEKRIKNFDLGKIKSVQNYLNAETKNPAEIIVKLSAILTDFQPRPYAKWSQQQRPKETNLDNRKAEYEVELTNDGANILTVTTEENKIASTETAKITTNFKHKKSILITSACLAIGSLGFVLSNSLEKKDCVYWNGEQYMEVACSNSEIRAEIFPLKDKSLLDLRKITRTDTLDQDDVHKIWYSKIKNKVEFFTAPGYHPVEKDKPLKPATWYMIKKYKSTENIPEN